MAAFVSDFVSQYLGAVSLYCERERGHLVAVIVIGIVLSALCWAGCSLYTRLWNLGFRATRLHHFLCGLAALFTFGAALLYPSLDYMKETSERKIASWEDRLSKNADWAAATFEKGFAAVRDLNEPDFEKHSHTPSGRRVIPVNLSPKVTQTYVKLIADEAIQDFQSHHPFLGRILGVPARIPADSVAEDLRTNPRATDSEGAYPMTDDVRVASRTIRAGLERQAPRAVYFTRVVIVVLLLILQFGVAAIIGAAAYKDLKVVTSTGIS